MYFLFPFCWRKARTVDELVKKCKGSPWRLSIYLWQRIWYEKEEAGNDKWQTPEETLDLHKGDCDDFSILAKAVLEKMGFNPFLFGVYEWEGHKRWEKKGHLVVVFYQKGRYWHISNWGLKESIETSAEVKMTEKVYEEIAGTVYKDAKIWRVFNENKNVLERGDRVATTGYLPYE